MRAALRHQLQIKGERPVFRTGDLSVDLVRRIVKIGDKVRSRPSLPGVASWQQRPVVRWFLQLWHRVRALVHRACESQMVSESGRR